MMEYQDMRDYLRRTRSSRYPIEGHWLAAQEHFLKNCWCKMLCMVLQSGKNVMREQQLFLQRLIAGVEAEYDAQTYMRQGLEVKPEELEEFLTILMDDGEEQKDLKRLVFVLDALILVHLGEEDEAAQELLAQLCEAMRFPIEKLAPLAKLCVDILKQDMPSAIIDAGNMGEEHSKCLLQPYLPKWRGTKIYHTEDSIAQIASERAPLAMSADAEIRQFSQELPIDEGRFNNVEGMFFENKSIVCLYNLDIHLNWHLCFSNVQKVLLINCKFTDNEKEIEKDRSVWFFNCEDVLIQNCSFAKIRGHMIYAVESKNLRILNTNFQQLPYDDQFSLSTWNILDENWGELGGVIHGTSGEMQLFLKNSQFKYILWDDAPRRWVNSNTRRDYCTFIISNCPAVIKGCHFNTCLQYPCDTKDGDKPRRCLFGHILSESDNELIDSAELGPH